MELAALISIPPVVAKIWRRGWQTLVTYSKEGYTEIVTEFYVNACNQKKRASPYTSYLSRKVIQFDPATINGILNIRKDQGVDNDWDMFKKDELYLKYMG